ncbi:MAG: pyridoxamine 5'-phosphate oxidase [Pelagibacteraceae bacterium]|nr:pyridoxamine 5'-phosphate oxidase [Pelagibacteraceae bacterium]|tara:strand:- start:22052 stop:22657 length:606 start_codon:yes stop_codon:yes gene_type:complete
MKNNNKILNLGRDPFNLFKQWFLLAEKKEINDPNAVNLSTVNKKNRPSSRMVLMKSFNRKGFTFYTNTNSKKGKDMFLNPFVCLNFHWKTINKQVRIEGRIKKVKKIESDKYFETRPMESKIGAWASNQSSSLLSRELLEKRFKFFKKKYKDKKINRPPFWLGYVVEPYLIEFWQEMPFRLHDRLEFRKIKGEWKSRKLYP